MHADRARSKKGSQTLYRKLLLTLGQPCSLSCMTELRFTGFVRGLPLTLEPNVFELIVGDRDDLRWGGKPNLRRIAQIAGVNHQRLAEASHALKNGDGSTGPYPHANTMGAVVRAYAVVHE